MRLPAPVFPALRSGPVVRWGVVAPGRIADAWVRTLHAHTNQRVLAVASRDLARAQQFAAKHGIGCAYGGYHELFEDESIDVVYIAAPHSEHRALALAAIHAGKHVLIEKPIALSAAQAEDIAAAARAAGVFALEAMWSAFLPQTSVMRQLIAAGTLGRVTSVIADFGGVAPFDPDGRQFSPALGGGVLLDMGVYPAWLAHFALGPPATVTARGTLASTGVEDQAALILDYTTGAQALITATLLAETPRTASISGELGCIELARPFYAPTTLRVRFGDDTTEWTDGSSFGTDNGDGLCYQACAAAGYITLGMKEAPEHTLQDAIAVLRVVDEAKAQLGAS